MVSTEEIIARIRARQDYRELKRVTTSTMEDGIAEHRRQQMMGRALRDPQKESEIEISLKANVILEEIRKRKYRPKEMSTAELASRCHDRTEQAEPVFKDWNPLTISLVEEKEDVDPFDYAMEMLEKK